MMHAIFTRLPQSWSCCAGMHIQRNSSPRPHCCTPQSPCTGCCTWWCPGSAGWTCGCTRPCIACRVCPSPSGTRWWRTTRSAPSGSAAPALPSRICCKHNNDVLSPTCPSLSYLLQTQQYCSQSNPPFSFAAVVSSRPQSKPGKNGLSPESECCMDHTTFWLRWKTIFPDEWLLLKLLPPIPEWPCSTIYLTTAQSEPPNPSPPRWLTWGRASQTPPPTPRAGRGTRWDTWGSSRRCPPPSSWTSLGSTGHRTSPGRATPLCLCSSSGLETQRCPRARAPGRWQRHRVSVRLKHKTHLLTQSLDTNRAGGCTYSLLESWAKGTSSAQHADIPSKMNHIKSRGVHMSAEDDRKNPLEHFFFKIQPCVCLGPVYAICLC